MKRWRELKPRAELNDFQVTLEAEQAIVDPVLNAAQQWLEDFIEQTPAKSLVGVAAKLSYQAEWAAIGYEYLLIDVGQVAEVGRGF